MNFRFTDFEIDIARRELRRAGAIVHVEPQVFDLLVHLIRHRDRFVPKDELIDAIWQGRIVSEATLSSRISAARRALGDSGNDQSLIRTLYKRGFRFVGDVDEDASAPAAHRDRARSPSHRAQPAMWRHSCRPANRCRSPTSHRLRRYRSRARGTIRTRSTLRTVSTAPLPPRRRFPIADRAPPGACNIARRPRGSRRAGRERDGADRAAGGTKPAVRRRADRRRVIAGHRRVAAVVALPFDHSVHERSHCARRRGRTGGGPAQRAGPVDHRPSLHQSQRRCQAGLPGRRDHRQPHQRPCARVARHLHRLPRHRVHLQRPGRRRAADRPRAGGALSARGQRGLRGRTRAREHPAGRNQGRKPAVGRAFRHRANGHPARCRTRSSAGCRARSA